MTKIRKRKKRRWFLKALGLVVVLVLGLFVKVYLDVQHTLASIQAPVQIQSTREKKVDVTKGEPLNILLIGVDSDSQARKEQEGYISRSDTLMIVSLNPQTRATKLLSIPRDTYTRIEGEVYPDKINHAYAYGGVELTIDTVQKYLDVPIDYYAVINMAGLVDLIDAIGGIEVTSPLTFTYRGTGFVKGETRLVNGVKAMNFARMRYDDPEGEVGRQNRQKLVIKAVIDKVLTLDSLTQYPKLLEVLSRNLKTNFDTTQLLSVVPNYLPALEQIGSVKFDTLEDLYIGDGFYFYIPMEARVRVANDIRQHTHLSPITASNLVDPLTDELTAQATKTNKIVINQYPTDLTEEQLERLLRTQDAVQAARETEYYAPAYYEYYEAPFVPTAPVSAPVNSNSSSDSASTSTPAPTSTSTPTTPATNESNATGTGTDTGAVSSTDTTVAPPAEPTPPAAPTTPPAADPTTPPPADSSSGGTP
ncbi:MAG: LCP family protein [Aerococcaceae bacterium]|nr:LCP family protein [Aerococcaceae bacterium]